MFCLLKGIPDYRKLRNIVHMVNSCNIANSLSVPAPISIILCPAESHIRSGYQKQSGVEEHWRFQSSQWRFSLYLCILVRQSIVFWNSCVEGQSHYRHSVITKCLFFAEYVSNLFQHYFLLIWILKYIKKSSTVLYKHN
jgi:hypothetical protein